jgi:hypothetical protein
MLPLDTELHRGALRVGYVVVAEQRERQCNNEMARTPKRWLVCCLVFLPYSMKRERALCAEFKKFM